MFVRSCATALAFAAVASATKSLSLSATAPERLTDVSGLEVTTIVTNTGDEDLVLLKDPRTVLSTWATAESWTVTSAEDSVPAFTGVKVRYIPEVAAKLAAGRVTLAAGESFEIVHEVGTYYNFSSVGDSYYTFTPSNVFQVIDESGALSTITAEIANAPGVELSGQLSSTKALSPASIGGSSGAVQKRSLEKRASYTSSCSTARRTTNNAAISAASGYASKSVTHLNNNPSGSTTQTTWYGTFSSSRRSVTLTSFQRLVSTPNSWTYDCSCTDSGTYAYVYPSQYGTVYLCGYYWQAPATGSGSRADTIIHEGTHFTQILGTDDWAYGESACRSLASSNPTRAVDNADNHAFFSVYS